MASPVRAPQQPESGPLRTQAELGESFSRSTHGGHRGIEVSTTDGVEERDQYAQDRNRRGVLANSASGHVPVRQTFGHDARTQ